MASFHVALFFFSLFLLSLAGQGGANLSLSQHDSPAEGLFVTDLKGVDGDEVLMAAHYHDFSFVGFTNRSRHWHAFRGDEGVLPTASPLTFRNTCRDLISGLKNLPDLPLGRASSLQAIRVLSSYYPDTAGDEEPAVLKLSVVLTQAARLKPIMETVEDGWEGEARVKAEHLPYIEHWDTMSFELIRWNRTCAWDGPFTEVLRKRANIRTAEEALAIADVLANSSFVQLLLAHSHSA